jgi:hypothetical protein
VETDYHSNHSTDHKAFTRSSILQTARGYAAKGIPAFTPKGQQPLTPQPELADRHRRELEDGSGIAPELRVMRGYRTISGPDALSLGFSEEQARAGLLIPFYTPTGEVSYQLKPDKPRTAHNKTVKYETRAGHDITLDVHPTNYARLLQSNEAFHVIEGIKKADCAATCGRLAVGLSGVWNWGKKRKRGGAKYGRPELLGDWDAIPLEGRTVYICFDADYRDKQNVALAMLRLAERLSERGARVYIASLPGPEKGLDDYVVAGGGLDTLEKAARPFTASDLIRYAAKPDKRIRAVVASIADRMKIDDWTQPWTCTTHSLLRTLLELALLGGRYDRDSDAVEVMMGTRELRNYAAIGSLTTLTKHTAKLEERGYVKKVAGDRKRGRANRYILKFSKPVSVIERGYEVPTTSIADTPLENFAPHLRWPAPASLSPRKDDRDSKLPKPGDTPTNFPHEKPNLASVYQVDGEAPSSVLEHTELEAAMGKTVEMALHLLLSWGGESSLRDLSTATGVNDTSKMRKKLEAAGEVFDLDPKGKHGARVRLTGEWQRRLDERRERAGELRRGRQQAVKNRQAREEFRKNDDQTTEPEPELAGPERVADMVAKADERHRKARVEEQRRKVGMTPEVFLGDALQDASGFGWRELRALWIAKGGKPEDLRRAVKDPYQFRREHDSGPLYVIKAIEGHSAIAEREPAPVAVLREPTDTKMPESEASPDGIYHHGPFCDCDWCSAPRQPRYARSFARSRA